MAVKIGDVTIRIGASTNELEKDLRKAERALQATAQKFSRIGQDLTIGLTAPLAAFGVAATASFAEFERLTKSLEAITGDASLAAEQFERLKVIAEAPGLALPQVVSASAKLQAVGLSAEQAEKTITEYGNAVARSGGGAQEFDGAVLALTQIASKGKISAEEINQLGERIFEIRPALQAAFGTANSEELQKLGISAQEFISRTTSELSKLERVQGGLSNSFENFRDSINGSLATLGEAISESINLPKVLDSISGAIKSVATAFENLSPKQKRFAVSLAGIVASLGPLSFLIGKTIKLYSELSTAFVRAAVAIAAKSTATKTETTSTITGTATTIANTAATNINTAATTAGATATDIATKKTITFTVASRAALSVIGPYALAIGLAVSAAYALSNATGNATESIADLNSVRVEGLKSAAKELSQAEQLIKIVRDETKAKTERNQALKDLAAINPQYFSGLTIERDGLEKINTQYNLLVSNIKQAATARAAEGRLQTLADKRIDLQEELAKEEQKALKFSKEAANFNAAKSRDGVNYARTNLDNSLAIQANIKKEIELIDQQSNKLADLAKIKVGPIGKNNGGGGGGNKEVDDLTKKINSLNEELINNERLFQAGLISGPEAASEQLNILQQKLETLITSGLSPTSTAVKDVKDSIEELRNVGTVDLLPSTDPNASFEKAIGILEENILKGTTTASNAVDSILKSTSGKVQQFYVSIGEGFVDFTGNYKNFTKDIFKSIEDNLKTATEKIRTNIEPIFNDLSNLLGSIFSQRQANLDQYYENEKYRIENSVMSEEQKAQAIARLDEETLKKRRAIARKQAAIDKAQALFSATLSGAEAVVKAFGRGGPILAAITAGLVAAQIAAIAAQPLPSLAIGTDLVKKDGLAMIHKGEAVVPANVVKGGFTGGGGQLTGRLSGIDILISARNSERYLNRIG